MMKLLVKVETDLVSIKYIRITLLQLISVFFQMSRNSNISLGAKIHNEAVVRVCTKFKSTN